MASEKIFRSAVFGGFNRSDVISYIEDLRNEISDLQRKYADKETKINELEDKVGDLTEKCASLNDLQEKYNVQCDTVEALKNENVELNNKVSELQNISDKYDESVCEFELKEQKLKLQRLSSVRHFWMRVSIPMKLYRLPMLKPLIFRQRLRLKYRNKLLR